ncbi:hypothetical protein PEPMIC_01648 [Parvimonas micra ATCC 33270]|uniref:Uncharacterized protein n=1 Tax=Parvimonas micra ATCC 33270 TaxID=411465 RepID=A8SNE8_9FIRM|nr:hypothetical protein PEPMIC_01648 [Parvimonas micra ATCC 33270]
MEGWGSYLVLFDFSIGIHNNMIRIKTEIKAITKGPFSIIGIVPTIPLYLTLIRIISNRQIPKVIRFNKMLKYLKYLHELFLISENTVKQKRITRGIKLYNPIFSYP